MAIDQSRRTVSGAVIRPSSDDLAEFIRSCRHIRYSPKADILFFSRGRLEPGFTVEPGGCLAYRISYDKTRLVAVELHNFKALVLPANPLIALAWKKHAGPLQRLTLMRERTLRFLLDKVAQFVDTCDDGTAGQFAHV